MDFDESAPHRHFVLRVEKFATSRSSGTLELPGLQSDEEWSPPPLRPECRASVSRQQQAPATPQFAGVAAVGSGAIHSSGASTATFDNSAVHARDPQQQQQSAPLVTATLRMARLSQPTEAPRSAQAAEKLRGHTRQKRRLAFSSKLRSTSVSRVSTIEFQRDFYQRNRSRSSSGSCSRSAPKRTTQMSKGAHTKRVMPTPPLLPRSPAAPQSLTARASAAAPAAAAAAAAGAGGGGDAAPSPPWLTGVARELNASLCGERSILGATTRAAAVCGAPLLELTDGDAPVLDVPLLLHRKAMATYNSDPSAVSALADHPVTAGPSATPSISRGWATSSMPSPTAIGGTSRSATLESGPAASLAAAISPEKSAGAHTVVATAAAIRSFFSRPKLRTPLPFFPD